MQGLVALLERKMNGTIATPRLYKQVVDHLMGALQAGVYEIGDRLPAERELASLVGVSRQVVREAVIALEILGLIEVRCGSGCYVTRLPGDVYLATGRPSLLELLEALFVVESEGLRLASHRFNIGDKKAGVLSEAARTIAEADDHGSWLDALLEFHGVLAESSENPAIQHTINNLWTLAAQNTLLVTASYYESVSRNRVTKDHRTICALIQAGSINTAANAIGRCLGGLLGDQISLHEKYEVEKARERIRAQNRRFIPTA